MIEALPVKTTSAELRTPGNTELQNRWQWRSRDGQMHYPEQMATRHLFYTLRMIWNHRMPVKFGPFQPYDFAGFYSDAYFKEAIVNLSRELAVRKDLTPDMEKVLAGMVEYLKKPQLEVKP